MPKICYETKTFSPKKMQAIRRANAICDEYAADGLVLTLRQLYYQFVARGWIGNEQKNYKWLGAVCGEARMAGLMDWDHLHDLTRNLADLAHWDSPEELVQAAANQFRTDRWADQSTRVQVWIEKDAAIGVIAGTCQTHDVPYFSCRGYTSMSELWNASQRIRRILRGGQDVVIVHIGDHDPSGLDMSRDIEARLVQFIETDGRTELGELMQGWLDRENAWREHQVDTFVDLPDHIQAMYRGRAYQVRSGWGRLEVRRIALNYEQVLDYNPPPNPAKTTDSRYRGYVQRTGLDESWELDALEPRVLQGMIVNAIEQHRDDALWARATEAMEQQRQELLGASRQWAAVQDLVRRNGNH